MRPDANDLFDVERVVQPVPSAQRSMALCSADRSDQAERVTERPAGAAPVCPASRLYPVISTERIMQAVEQQKRVTQELEDLCVRQQASAQRLRQTTISLMVGASGVCGLLALTFILLTLFQPEILAHLLNLAGSTIALGFAVGEEIKTALAPLPSNSWFFSGVALAIVAMVGLWLHLMHCPREV